VSYGAHPAAAEERERIAGCAEDRTWNRGFRDLVRTEQALAAAEVPVLLFAPEAMICCATTTEVRFVAYELNCLPWHQEKQKRLEHYWKNQSLAPNLYPTGIEMEAALARNFEQCWAGLLEEPAAPAHTSGNLVPMCPAREPCRSLWQDQSFRPPIRQLFCLAVAAEQPL